MTYLLPSNAVQDAYYRISPYIKRTPLLQSNILNQLLKHDIRFKVESLQTTGSFKIRGTLNAMLSLKEQANTPKNIVTFSSRNHAQAVAFAGYKLGINTTIFLPEFTSNIKRRATIAHGAKVITTKNRIEAEQGSAEMAHQGAYFIHPYDNDMIIAGQGTACLEALQEFKPHAIFAPCSGGGLLSGTYLAAQLVSPDSKIFAGEPAKANDASLSYRAQKIVRFQDSPVTIADGARALAVSERTFSYLQQLDGFYDLSETDICYWTQ